MEILGSNWMGFYEVLYLSIFQGFVKKTQVSLKSDKNNRYFIWRHINLWYLIELFWEWGTFWTKVVNKIRTHILSSVTFFQISCHLWDVEKCGRVREATNNNVIWRLCFACWTTKATHLHSEYEILTGFPWQQWLQKHILFCLYIHCLSCSLYLAFNVCKNWSHRFTVVWNNVSQAPYTLSVKLSDFSVWRHTWW
jgi:hypothetical protein